MNLLVMALVTALLLSSSYRQMILTKKSFVILWSRILLKYLANCSYVALIDSPNVYWKLLMQDLNFNFFDIRKYLSKNIFCISSHVDIEHNRSSNNHTISLLARDNGNTQSLTTSVDKFYFPIIPLQMNNTLWRQLCGSLDGQPENNPLCYSIYNNPLDMTNLVSGGSGGNTMVLIASIAFRSSP